MPRALITDLAADCLSEDERVFLRDFDPLGIVLFSRNIRTPDQLAALIADFRSCVGRPEAPVMIDQEGGRVARLREPHWWSGVPAARLGRAGPEAAWLAGRLMACDMAALGIDVVCAPCLDLGLPGMHEVIGDRAFAADPATVSACGRAYADGLLAGGVEPMIKHMPGHGRVTTDPHHALPVSDADPGTMWESDFLPFRDMRRSVWGMTSHVVYTALDSRMPATQSPRIIDGIIRGEIGFEGVLVSDAIDMAALSGSHEDRACRALEAGCNVVMHCNQPLAGRRAVAAALGELGDRALECLHAAAARRTSPPEGFDRAGARAELDAMLGPA